MADRNDEQSLARIDEDSGSEPIGERSIERGDEKRDEKSGTTFGIYKYGRGYWVRIMTAVALGMLFMSGAAWAWNQLEALSLPNRAWTLAVTQTEGAASVGQSVTFEQLVDGKAQPLGTGVLESVTTQGKASATLTVANVRMNDGYASPREANHVSIAATTGGVATLTGALQGQQAAIGVPVFQRVYLQGAVALALLLVGCGIVYQYVARKPASVEFLIATDEEMRKVNWSTRKIIIDSTQVVIMATFLIAGYIFIADLVMKMALFEQIVR